MIKTLSGYLTPSRIIEAEERLSRSLADLFQRMFKLEVTAVDLPPNRHFDVISASITLEHETTLSCVFILIPKEVAALIARQAGVDSALYDSVPIVQDITCEIVNIVGNNLRAYFSEAIGISFKLGRPTPGFGDLLSLRSSDIKLHFQIKSHNPIELGFMYGESSENRK